MSKILESTKFVVENSKDVHINRDKIVEFCNNFEHKGVKHWLDVSPFDLSSLDNDDVLNFLLVFNAVSFSYWGKPKWTIEHKGKKYDGSWGMIVAIGRAIEKKKPILDPQYLATISKDDFQEILDGNVEIPLFEERWKVLREIGKILSDKYDGEFKNIIEESKRDALKLLDLIVKIFSSFNDLAEYEGKKIYFYKRAQLLTADVCHRFKKRGLGEFKNTDKLTACADYKIPQVLRRLGIFEYSPELANKVDNENQIPKGDKHEVEIRANTIWAVEFIKEQLKKYDSTHVNDHLWLLGQDKLPGDKPYHRTRTTSY
ncbi:MAG: queuosine salvage family protein [Nanoarchaeota archaeon]